MFCLDTNWLIGALRAGSDEAKAVEEWLGAGEELAMPMVAWYEFLSGCTEEEERIGKAVLTGGVLPFSEAEAQEAARLFRETGRSRGLRVDAMIAATALVRRVRLATRNVRDFERFVGMGLQLVS